MLHRRVGVRLRKDREYSGRKLIRNGQYEVVGKVSTKDKLIIKCTTCGRTYDVFRSSVVRGDANPCSCNKVGAKIVGKVFNNGCYKVVEVCDVKHLKVKIECLKCGKTYIVNRSGITYGAANPCKCNKKSTQIDEEIKRAKIRGGKYKVLGRSSETVKGSIKVDVQCLKCGKVYKVKIDAVRKGVVNPCKDCYPRKASCKLKGELLKDGKYLVLGAGTTGMYEIQCTKCRKVYQVRIGNIINGSFNPCSCHRSDCRRKSKCRSNRKNSIIGKLVGYGKYAGKYTVVSKVFSEADRRDYRLNIECNKCGKIYNVSRSNLYSAGINPCSCDKVTGSKCKSSK